MRTAFPNLVSYCNVSLINSSRIFESREPFWYNEVITLYTQKEFSDEYHSTFL